MPKNTFRVVSLKYEKYLEASSQMTQDSEASKKFKEDLDYLRMMHTMIGDNRYGTLGPFDRSIASAKKKSDQRKHRQRNSLDINANQSSPTSSTESEVHAFESSTDNDDSSDSDYVASPEKKKPKATTITLTKKVIKQLLFNFLENWAF